MAVCLPPAMFDPPPPRVCPSPCVCSAPPPCIILSSQDGPLSLWSADTLSGFCTNNNSNNKNDC